MVSTIKTQKEKKEQLLEMARNGEPRPSREHHLGSVFRSYICKSHQCHDSEFIEKLKIIRPDWVITKKDIIKEKKEQLLEMARNGEPRPHEKKHALGVVFRHYTLESSDCYDAQFKDLIFRIAPSWIFVNTADENKKQLLEMAKKGEPKPTSITNIGKLFQNYVHESNHCYDAVFTEKIKSLRPDWLFTKRDIAKKIKKQLLEMAKGGSPKPQRHDDRKNKHSIGWFLEKYTRSSHKDYDSFLTDQLKMLRPDWFGRNSKQKQIIDSIESIKDSLHWLPPIAWYYVLIQSGIKNVTEKHYLLLNQFQNDKISFNKLSNCLSGNDIGDNGDRRVDNFNHKIADIESMLKLLNNPIFAGLDEDAVKAIECEFVDQIWKHIYKNGPEVLPKI